MSAPQSNAPTAALAVLADQIPDHGQPPALVAPSPGRTQAGRHRGTAGGTLGRRAPGEAPAVRPILLPQHAALIEASAISKEVAEARGYRSVTTKAELDRLGFSKSQQITPTLLHPIWNVWGENGLSQHRPDQPRTRKRGSTVKPVKYEFPAGATMHLDVPPCVRPLIGDPNRPLFITEGIRKADAAAGLGLACIAVIGVWNFRGTNDQGGKTLLADFERIAFNGREVYLCFDSDVMLKREVYEALVRLAEVVKRRQARVRFIYLPTGAGGTKLGLDDFIALGHGIDDLLALATTELRRPSKEAAERDAAYFVTDGALYWNKPTRDGPVPTLLGTFAARITAEVIRDDGVETTRAYEMEGAIAGRSPRRFTIPAHQFASMNWPLEYLGIGAVLSPGMGLRDHARAATQHRSGDVEERRTFTHTGWRTLAGVDLYLHGGGAIGPDGPVDGITIDLAGSLGRYVLPVPPVGDDLRAAVRASTAVLDVAPDSVTAPILGGVYRAPLGGTDFSEHLTGETGQGKSEIAALAIQHFGAGMDARHLPASWTSTGNALEGLAFAAKDTLLIVDDFVAGASPGDAAKIQAAAERLFRSQGNHAGRQRMRADTSLREPKPPRGLVLSTGEDIPRGHSLRSRLLVVELPKDALDWGRLSALQRSAADGQLAAAMAGYIRYLAGEGAVHRMRLAERVQHWRDTALASGQHRRTPSIVGELAAGWEAWLRFAEDCGAISAEAAAMLWQRVWAALGTAAGAQAAHQQASEPAGRFIELLRAAFVSGRAHVATPYGAAPANASVWGWRAVSLRDDPELRPQGELIGWVSGDDLYLEPTAAFAVAQRLARDTGDGFTVTMRTVHQRLLDRGLIQSADRARDHLTIRKVIGGQRRYVLHLSTASFILNEPAQPAHPAHTHAGGGDRESTPAGDGPESWARTDRNGAQPAHDSGPSERLPESEAPAHGPDGPDGPVAGTGEGEPVDLAAAVEALVTRLAPIEVRIAGEDVGPGRAAWRSWIAAARGRVGYLELARATLTAIATAKR